MKNKADKPITKPPTKAQIISVMVEEAMNRRTEVIERIDKEIEELEKKAIGIASKVRVPPVSKWNTDVQTYQGRVGFSYNVTNESIVAITKKIVEAKQNQRRERNKTKSQITAEIRRKLGDPKPAITDPETMKSVTDRLTLWGY